MRLINTITVGFMLLLTAFAAAAQSTDQTPKFTRTIPELERRDQPVAEEDLRILIRADEILIDETVWNREDDRTRP